MAEAIRKFNPPAQTAAGPVRLNLGCGRSPLPGWVNIDKLKTAGVDIGADLDRCRDEPLPFADNSVDNFFASHVIEHIEDTLGLMQELHRIAKPDALLVARVPYGSSDDAWEEPTHVRPYFIQSWGYFSQPYFWRYADHPYRGDWQPETLELIVSKTFQGVDQHAILQRVFRERNIVVEMVATLRAVKPIREPKRDLQVLPKITFLALA